MPTSWLSTSTTGTSITFNGPPSGTGWYEANGNGNTLFSGAAARLREREERAREEREVRDAIRSIRESAKRLGAIGRATSKG